MKNGETELNTIILNIMPNRCSNQAYVQGFYCKNIKFLKSVNMSEYMEISQDIYEDVVETYYKNLLYHILTVLVSVVKLGEDPTHQRVNPICVSEMVSASKGM